MFPFGHRLDLCIAKVGTVEDLFQPAWWVSGSCWVEWRYRSGLRHLGVEVAAGERWSLIDLNLGQKERFVLDYSVHLGEVCFGLHCLRLRLQFLAAPLEFSTLAATRCKHLALFEYVRPLVLVHVGAPSRARAWLLLPSFFVAAPGSQSP